MIFSEINAGFFYKSAEEREKLVASERKFIDDRVQKVIELKKKVTYFPRRWGGAGRDVIKRALGLALEKCRANHI